MRQQRTAIPDSVYLLFARGLSDASAESHFELVAQAPSVRAGEVESTTEMAVAVTVSWGSYVLAQSFGRVRSCYARALDRLSHRAAAHLRGHFARGAGRARTQYKQVVLRSAGLGAQTLVLTTH